MNNEGVKPFTFESMGVTYEDALQIAKTNNSTRKKHDGLICICGHSSSRHEVVMVQGAPAVNCTPSRLSCNCAREKYVMKTSKIFHFIRKTHGNGTLHALMSGAVATLEADPEATIVWLDNGPECEFCGTREPDDKVQPRCFTEQGWPINREHNGVFSMGYDKLCCLNCWTEKN